jgi:4-aminobutyrate aminotransferase
MTTLADASAGVGISHLSDVWVRRTPLEVVRAQGTEVTSVDGRTFLDFTSGVGVCNTGHCHPAVVEAIRRQAAEFIHAQANVYRHPLLEELAARLALNLPASLNRLFFANSGAEAVEAAVKLVRHATGRPNLICFEGSFHGRTAQTMAMTSSKALYRGRFGPLPSGVFFAPYPYWYRTGETPDVASARCLDAVERLLATQTAPEETAAVVIEPVLGEGGIVASPPSFLPGLQRICRAHGMLLVVDEIHSGFGRTGRLFAFEHFTGVEPDVVVMGKGLASGFPISAVGASAETMSNWATGSHGGTYGGNPIGCAAALATLDVLDREQLPENAAVRGRQLFAGLRAAGADQPALGDVRGLGLMVGLEVVGRRGEPAPTRAAAIVDHCREEGGVILIGSGTDGNVIRILPPLTVAEEEIDRGLGAIRAAIAATT